MHALQHIQQNKTEKQSAIKRMDIVTPDEKTGGNGESGGTGGLGGVTGGGGKYGGTGSDGG